MGKECSISVVMVIVFLILQLHLSVQNEVFGNGFVYSCQKLERDALFKLKNSVSDPGRLLSSWKGEDCCRWSGVRCNNVTGHVEILDLRNTAISDHVVEYSRGGLVLGRYTPNGLRARKLDLNSCLIELKHLKYLDLSRNDFQGSPIPESIGFMKELRYLNLSGAAFAGAIPPWFRNLTKLQVLDLSWNYNDTKLTLYSLTVGDLRWLSGLSSLQFLDMSLIDFSHASDLIHALDSDNHPSLLDLRLQQCQLGNTHLSHAFFSNSTWHSTIHRLVLSFNNLNGPVFELFANMSSLISLDLSYNQLSSSIPLWLQNMKNLESLSLASNSFNHVEGGVMGIIGKLCKLKELDLSSNQLEGEILGFPKNLSKLCTTFELESLDLSGNRITDTLLYWSWEGFKKLKHLYLSNNRLFGQIPESIGSLSSLKVLDLSKNNLNGTIPSSLGQLPYLNELSLDHNMFNGHIPSFHTKFCSLMRLDLSNNRFTGRILEYLGQCNKLTYIGVSTNFFQGVVSDYHFANLSNLKVLDLSFNSLTLNFSSDWNPPFQLRWLSTSSNIINGNLPPWIQTQNQLKYLDISNCEVLGNMPTWFWHKDLAFLNLSYNHITGPITYFSSRISTIDLSHNSLSGSILQDNPFNTSLAPNSLCHLRDLSFLSLQNNSLSGTIPDCWHNSERLNVISLSMNNFSGHIPMTLSSCETLVILDLGENNLSGEIPSFGAKTHYLQILRLRENQLRGVIPQQLCSLSNLQILDLARNNLIGSIPHCLGNLNSMKSLYLNPDVSVISPISSPNSQEQLTEPIYFGGESAIENLKGQELEYTKTLYLVVNLDLSCNGLVGFIPEELTSLSGLIGLNLSNNHLVGKIPEKIGQMSSLESLDLSNNNLSGTIPTSIVALNFLTHLNLSYNKLHGYIPLGSQLQVLDDPSMIYIGNPKLCGDPLPNKCAQDHNQQEQDQEQEDDYNEDDHEKALFYGVVMLGVATGFWGVIGVLLLMKSWSYALFQFVEDCIDYLVVKANKLRS